MIRRAAAAAALVSVLAVALLSVSAVSADATFDSVTVSNGYPKDLTFKVSAHSSSDITDATLSYAITGRNTSAIGKPDNIQPGKQLDTSVVVQVNSSSSYIPVGSEFTYHWELTMADGSKASSPDQKFLFLPTGQDWKSVSGDFMTVYYHGDKQDLANSYLKAGIETFKKMGTDLLHVQLAVVPVKVILFDNEQESAQARPPTSTKFDAAVTTCGTKVTQDIVLVIPVSCGTSDRTDTLRHEFTHIINATAGEGPLGKLPSWLDEGTAVNGQTSPGDNYTGSFQSAVRNDRLIPFAQMGTAPSDAAKVNLFYGQSYFMAKHLIDKGADKYAQFFGTIKKGARFDDALKQTYGFDLAGFEAEFRQANGLKPQQAGSPTTAPTARPTSTRAVASPTAAPTSKASTNDSGGNDTRTMVIIIAIAVLFALLAVFAYLTAMFLGNSRKKSPPLSSPPPSAPPSDNGGSEIHERDTEDTNVP